MKTGLLKILRRLPERKDVMLNKKAVTFIICLLISTFFWMLITFSKNYTTNVTFPVKYEHIPTDRIITNRLVKELNIKVNATGFSILGYQLGFGYKPVRIDLRDIRLYRGNTYYISINSKIDKISAQFGQSIRIIKIMPDTIFIDFNPKVTRMIPVVPDLSLNFDPQYQLYDSIRTDPADVEVAGASTIVDTLKVLHTRHFVLSELNKSVTKEVPLDLKGLEGLSVSTQKVKVNVPVAKYTEGNMQLAIDVKNLPAGYTIKTFPDKATVRYLVALKDFNTITPDMFHVVADYAKLDTTNPTELKLQLVLYPHKVKRPAISPEKVEYIIRK